MIVSREDANLLLFKRPAARVGAKAWLVGGGERRTATAFGLSEGHILTIEPEAMLGRKTIEDQFDPTFFKTSFWYMWCTTFAFQPWHSAVEFKRYLVRFAHINGGSNRLTGIMRTVYNQHDSMVLPIRKWLEERGVRFETGTRVVDLEFVQRGGGDAVSTMPREHGDWPPERMLDAA